MLGGATAPNIELHVVSGVLPHPGNFLGHVLYAVKQRDR